LRKRKITVMMSVKFGVLVLSVALLAIPPVAKTQEAASNDQAQAPADETGSDAGPEATTEGSGDGLGPESPDLSEMKRKFMTSLVRPLFAVCASPSGISGPRTRFGGFPARPSSIQSFDDIKSDPSACRECIFKLHKTVIDDPNFDDTNDTIRESYINKALECVPDSAKSAIQDCYKQNQDLSKCSMEFVMNQINSRRNPNFPGGMMPNPSNLFNKGFPQPPSFRDDGPAFRGVPGMRGPGDIDFGPRNSRKSKEPKEVADPEA
jgi:hypothetical protein